MPVKGINCLDSDTSQEKFAVPHPLKHANPSRSTPKKTPLSRSKSIPGLSSSGTTKASPVTPRGGTPKNNKLSTGGRSISSTKLADSGTPVAKHNHNAETHFHRVQTSAPSIQNITPVKRGTAQKQSAYNTAEKISLQRDTTSLPATPECFDVVHLETPRKTMDELTSADCPDWLSQVGETSTEGETSNLTVGVRVRPLNAREVADPSVKVVISMKENEVTVDMCNETGMSHVFTYDYCFWSAGSTENQGMPHSSQEYVYNKLVHPLLDKAFEGYNACLFAYGQTGSGKSYSMMGSGMDQIVDQPEVETGIIPRFCHKIFERIAQLECSDSSVSSTSDTPPISNVSVEISYFEIYNEKIHDLLGDSDGTRSKRAPLRVREHPVFGPHVVDLSTYVVVSYKDLQEWIMVGNSRRATAATEMNEKSSRSHSIFSVMLTQTEVRFSSAVIMSKMLNST
ncbi:hypothetical protein J437_LFUL004949 [Ladona fulva]|uniref:Kinesin motor domain-containing protein n=1 Tax=Ladona fulva TaxID=123851 RepID=A0A8K0KNB1_LADFU|nr:hypothetical protein J437_LFUL004949 [Ladona fulva]